jgi:RNA polymerase sigma-70 factor (ECF subfamily)
MSEALAQPLSMTETAAPPIESFEHLYRETFRRVYGYVASLLRDPSAAEEVTAQAFERAYRKRATFRPGRGSAEAWLFGIASKAALDELRHRRRRATLETESVDECWCAGPAELAENEERRAAVRRALASLGPRERDLVALKFAGGLSNVEIAGVVGLSPSNTGTRLHRAVQKLREACREEL